MQTSATTRRSSRFSCKPSAARPKPPKPAAISIEPSRRFRTTHRPRPLSPRAPAQPDPAASVAQAQRYWENGDYTQAERLLRRVLQQKPDFAPAKLLFD